MSKDDIRPIPPNEAISLVRCRVDDDHNLREVESGAFVRRILGEDGLIGEMPADADLGDGYVSLIMLPKVPESFVRLEHPDDENVITRLMALDVDVSKFKIFASLYSVAKDPRFDEAEVEAIENTLAQLADLSDVDGVEDLIEQRLL